MNRLCSQRSTVFLQVFVMFVTIGASIAAAQVAVSPYRGDTRYVGARGGALAGALGSDAYDIEAILWNPASMNTLQNTGVAISHRNEWDQHVFDESIMTRLAKWSSHSVGASVRYTHSGLIGTAQDFKFQQIALDIAYAYEVVTDLSIGIVGGGRLGTQGGLSTTSYSMSIGILYSPSPAVSYGLAMRDLGRNLKFLPLSSTAESAPERDVFRPAALEISSTLRFPTKSRSHFVQLLVAVEHNLLTEIYSYRGGLEVLPFDFLALRLGYLNADRTMASAGLGLMVGGFEVDFAIMPQESGTRFHEVSVKYIY